MSEITSAQHFTPENLRSVLQKFNSDLGVYINEEERYRLGKVLTIIDASFADTEQRKAVKDLINNMWYSQYDRARNVGSMTNPHRDLSAICEIFGFNLFGDHNESIPTDVPYEYEKSRYKEVINK